MRLRDFAVDGHAHRVRERHDPPLEELVVVGGQGIGRQAVRGVAVRDLVEVGVGRAR